MTSKLLLLTTKDHDPVLSRIEHALHEMECYGEDYYAQMTATHLELAIYFYGKFIEEFIDES